MRTSVNSIQIHIGASERCFVCKSILLFGTSPRSNKSVQKHPTFRCRHWEQHNAHDSIPLSGAKANSQPNSFLSQGEKGPTDNHTNPAKSPQPEGANTIGHSKANQQTHGKKRPHPKASRFEGGKGGEARKSPGIRDDRGCELRTASPCPGGSQYPGGFPQSQVQASQGSTTPPLGEGDRGELEDVPPTLLRALRTSLGEIMSLCQLDSCNPGVAESNTGATGATSTSPQSPNPSMSWSSGGSSLAFSPESPRHFKGNKECSGISNKEEPGKPWLTKAA